MILLDTSVLIDAFTRQRPLAEDLRSLLESEDPVRVPALVMFEWLRGPREQVELRRQESLFPTSSALSFGSEEARAASSLYRAIDRPRRRELDLMIAAQALVEGARLWTQNGRDFADVPGLTLYQP